MRTKTISSGVSRMGATEDLEKMLFMAEFRMQNQSEQVEERKVP